MSTRSYHELLHISDFVARFEYLALYGGVGHSTFGHDRWINQAFYQSRQWKQIRQFVILRDDGCDLGVPGYDIYGSITIHHIIPMTAEDIEAGNPLILDPDNLITTTHDTHNAIHYGDAKLLRLPLVERAPGDTVPWR
jgi:5-methylcytosine-specific restriction endonuclease McrA